MIDEKPWGQVYLIRNLVNGKGYVGQTVQSLKYRWGQHRRSNGCWLLKRAIKKYGVDAFAITHLEYASSAGSLNEKERVWILKLGTHIPTGYNILLGGEQPASMRALKSASRKRFLAQQAAKGLAKGPSSLSEADVRAIFKEYDKGSSVTHLAIAYGVVQSTISHILRGSTWSHLGLRTERSRRLFRATEVHAEEVFRLNHTGLMDREVVVHTGLSLAVVTGILSGRIHPAVCARFGGRKRARRLLDGVTKARILVLRGEGLSLPKIAKLVGVSTSTVWSTCRAVCAV